ncbi:hypothetical protein BOW53_14380 [Solemya pervernicosa gill symbiont]|uniref:DUF2157 domain-containing protein n=2 Tax=Gammaproteobacteria incertae sedis TaxID=118884 RepID=A0A1T2L0V0_9GAMM|nr:DUF2157 domain-containing protein [Candidatus Reidiella endopervernicosa]OOZ38708.1 hypothetical protein BOW53_14380 [Solemya pervernicosa gill symbiont]QKQ25818.1 DUF2157 domain-containing protein [Candidatus Reidiella endopervernicosa]
MRLIRLLKNDLAQEVYGWVKDGVISEAQGESICDRYGIDYHHDSHHSYGYYVLIALGYLFIGLAIITLLSANWDQIPRALRMGGLVAVTLATNVVGLRLFAQGREKPATIALLLGALLYGATIMLIAQIYHIGEHYPDGIFWWAAGVLPLALLMESGLLLALAMTLAYTWFVVEASMGYYPTLFPLFLVAAGWLLLYRRINLLLFFALVVGVAGWLETTLAWWQGGWRWFDFTSMQVTFGCGLAVISAALAQWFSSSERGGWQEYGVLLDLWSLRLVLLLLLVFSFDSLWWELIPDLSYDKSGNITVVVICSLSAVVINYLSGRARHSIYALAAIYLLLFGAAVLFASREDAVVLQIVDNLLLIGTGIWLIQRGIVQGVSHYFYLGVATVLITGLVRYIDLVGDYVGAAILFGIFAAILLYAARYWRKSRKEVHS